MKQFYHHIFLYKWIYFISFIGFIITGILCYPYGMHYDSKLVFMTQVVQNNNFGNWMGWFYPTLWKFLWSITKINNIIGVLSHLLYWISMPIIYIHLFKNPISEKLFHPFIYWYLLLALNPFVIGALLYTTNNSLVLSFVVFSLALFLLSFQYKNYFYMILSLFILLAAAFTRRDSLILCIPLVWGYSCLFYKKSLISVVTLAIFLGAFFSVNDFVTKNLKDYQYNINTSYETTIDTLGLISLYDLTAMSIYKKELLIPDSILQTNFQKENRFKIIDTLTNIGISKLAFEWNPFQNTVKEFLKSNNVWHSGLELKEALPIYLENWPTYLWFKLNIFYGYLIPLWPFLILGVLSLYILYYQPLRFLFSADMRYLLTLLVITGFIFDIAVILSTVSIQYRYIITANLLIWIVFVYIISVSKISIKFEPR